MNDSSIAALGPNARFIGVPGSRTGLSTPALLLDLDALDRNIAAMAAHARKAGIQLRPHSKGGKSIEIARRQVAAGAIGICCTTIGEAEIMAGAGIANVLITSPVVTPAMIDRLVALNGRTNGLIAVADNPANVDALAAACAKAGQTLSLLVEFDVGQNRSCFGVIDAGIYHYSRKRTPDFQVRPLQGSERSNCRVCLVPRNGRNPLRKRPKPQQQSHGPLDGGTLLILRPAHFALAVPATLNLEPPVVIFSISSRIGSANCRLSRSYRPRQRIALSRAEFLSQMRTFLV